jgi:CheY-like chemotaxis protein
LVALDVINNWRSSHNFPLNTFHIGLKKRAKIIDPKAITAQRIKRLASIETKLGRYPTMTLSQMQDIGGCRAIVATATDVSKLCESYAGSDLLKAGYRVVGPVPSVREALSFIDEDEVDAALLDYRLNDEDGHQIAEELAAHDILFAFLTGYDPKEIEYCRRHPCLQKPISTEILLRMVDALLEKRESRTSS